MNQPIIKIGLIGCGGRLRIVLRNLLAVPQTSNRIAITALFDPQPQATRQMREEFAPNARVFESEAALLAEGDVDWVMIGSWNCFHADQVIAALAAGKHIFCEKPLATSLDDCLRMKAALEKAPGQHFFFGLVLRYTPFYRQIKKLLDNGAIGRLVSFEFNETIDFNHGGYIHGNWRRRRENSGSHLLEKCCHDLDIANWLTGSLPVRAASFGGRDFFRMENRILAERLGKNASGRKAYLTWDAAEQVDPFSAGADIVDNQVVILEYGSGVHASFHTNCNAALIERRLYLLGTEGTLRGDAQTGVVELQRIGFSTKIERFETALEIGGHYGGDATMGAHLAQTMLEDVPELSTLDDGLRAAVSCFGVDDALDENRVIDLRPLWKKAGITLAPGCQSSLRDDSPADADISRRNFPSQFVNEPAISP